MPSFTIRLANLQSTGPVVEVWILPPAPLVNFLRANGEPIPSPVQVLALIDTGATSSVVEPEIISQIGLSPIGEVEVCTPTVASTRCYNYFAAIRFPNNVIVETPNLITADLPGQPIQCLIGRDILQHGVLIYNGYDQSITLSF